MSIAQVLETFTLRPRLKARPKVPSLATLATEIVTGILEHLSNNRATFRGT